MTADSLKDIVDLDADEDDGTPAASVSLASSTASLASSLAPTGSTQAPEMAAKRQQITPWLKFLWDSYRTVLDILRNNVKLEALYQDAACRAFLFCRTYKRPTEFRRMAEILRLHLAAQSKHIATMQQGLPVVATGDGATGSGAGAASAAEGDTLMLHLHTRFLQLDTAIALELWHEAYRSVEDVHGLLSLSRKPLDSSIMCKVCVCGGFFGELGFFLW